MKEVGRLTQKSQGEIRRDLLRTRICVCVAVGVLSCHMDAKIRVSLQSTYWNVVVHTQVYGVSCLLILLNGVAPSVNIF